jgi:hypothetical protein
MRNSKWSFEYMDELMRIGEKGKARDSNAALLNKHVKGRAEISAGEQRAHLSRQHCLRVDVTPLESGSACEQYGETDTTRDS